MSVRTLAIPVCLWERRRHLCVCENPGNTFTACIPVGNTSVGHNSKSSTLQSHANSQILTKQGRALACPTLTNTPFQSANSIWKLIKVMSNIIEIARPQQFFPGFSKNTVPTSQSTKNDSHSLKKKKKKRKKRS